MSFVLYLFPWVMFNGILNSFQLNSLNTIRIKIKRSEGDIDDILHWKGDEQTSPVSVMFILIFKTSYKRLFKNAVRNSISKTLPIIVM